MTDEDVLQVARRLGLDRAVETDPQSVIAAARRAGDAGSRIRLEGGRFGEPWPPMTVMK
ncbi:hypothetical protein [Oceanicola sp. 22II-s10i]|uniref:hypothetical protein n=1 Tax=Oceanicola sp. 22II-s10i TaxID=1317116 RepID=UPI0015950CB8|nr:hypothetical protein [Oceanicola sp. 22II-s10i]